MLTVSFWGSAASSGLTATAFVCQVGSKVVVFIICDQFVEALTATAMATSLFADEVERYSQNETGSTHDHLNSVL
jgi:hypothetical protein